MGIAFFDHRGAVLDANVLISGDRALLALGETENTRIGTPREFVKILGLDI